MNYGEIMDDIRFENRIKQKEMAKILGISTATYNAYEKQSLVIPLKHLINFCNYFHISLDYILGFSSYKNYENVSEEINLKEMGIRLRKLRKSLGFKQFQFAKELKILNSTLSEYEHGKILITTSTLYFIGKKYHISCDYLLGKIKEQELAFN